MSTALFDDGQTLLMLAAEQGWTELSAAWGMAQGALSRTYSLDSDVSFQPVTPENDDDDDEDDDETQFIPECHVSSTITVVIAVSPASPLSFVPELRAQGLSAAFTKVPLSLCDFMSQLVSRCAGGSWQRVDRP